MKYFIFTFFICALIFGLSLGTPAHAILGINPGPLVPCGNETGSECGFSDLIKLIQNIINYLIFIAAPVSAILFAYAGFIYLTAAGSMDKIKKAHSIFGSVFFGFVIILAAWLVVKTISVLLVGDFTLLN